ncbi:MAG: alpha-glucuronidase family glycosyl hydrolase [Asticcacaulis sp.]
MLRYVIAAACAACFATTAHADPVKGEDGYDLWLRYRPVEATYLTDYRAHATEVVGGDSATLKAAESELQRGFDGMLVQQTQVTEAITDGAIVLATPADMHGASVDLSQAGDEGFVITSTTLGGHPVTVIAGNSDTGVLYGALPLSAPDADAARR